MAHFERVFYYSATFEEAIAMLRDLCEQGFRVIPGYPFDEPAAPEYARVTDELVELLREGPGFYLGGDFARHGVQLMRLDGGPANGKYVVDELTQGPVLNGLLARQNIVDGAPTLLLGRLSRQQRYKNPESGQWEAASKELRAAYKRATTTMSKRLIGHESARFPIGPDALQLFQEGKARLQQYFVGVGST